MLCPWTPTGALPPDPAGGSALDPAGGFAPGPSQGLWPWAPLGALPETSVIGSRLSCVPKTLAVDLHTHTIMGEVKNCNLGAVNIIQCKKTGVDRGPIHTIYIIIYTVCALRSAASAARAGTGDMANSGSGFDSGHIVTGALKSVFSL